MTRTGKIARLPLVIRLQLNKNLADGDWATGGEAGAGGEKKGPILAVGKPPKSPENDQN